MERRSPDHHPPRSTGSAGIRKDAAPIVSGRTQRRAVMSSKSTHTEGPWTLEREVWVNKLGMGDDHACQEIHHNGTTLGYWVDCEWSGWSPNARLIAAAPDYHANAQRLHKDINGLHATMRAASTEYRSSELCRQMDALIRDNAAAIARAEGGAA